MEWGSWETLAPSPTFLQNSKMFLGKDKQEERIWVKIDKKKEKKFLFTSLYQGVALLLRKKK